MQKPRPQWQTWTALLASPITSARMNLVWRLFGLVLALLWIQHMDEDSVFTFMAKSAPALDALGLAGLVLLIAGPSPLVLLGSAAVGVWFMAAVLARQPSLDFVADEYAVQAGVPIVAAIVTAAHLGAVVYRRGPGVDARVRDELDELHARIFRIFTITTLAFAGLHKLNADFFAAGSCANLGSSLQIWWELPFDIPVAGPVEIVAFELLAALMLLVYPRIGILLVVYVMAGLGHIGPAAFAGTCVVMSLAFLDRGDMALVRAFLARCWGVVLAAVLVVTATSFSTYQSQLPWLKYGLLEALLVGVVCMVIGVGLARLQRNPGLRRRLTPAALRWWRRPAKVMPGLSSWLALILIVNGMSPYLGIKYRFSVAMLSNLRVDQERWNSYVVPDWVRLRKTTPQVVVVWRPMGKWAGDIEGGRELSDGLFSAAALDDALQDAASRGARGELSLTYLGETADFELPADLLGAMAWAQGRPSSVLWQERLGAGDQPQACVH